MKHPCGYLFSMPKTVRYRLFCIPQALTTASEDADTVVTAAIESANPALATRVLDCVQESISDPRQVKHRPSNDPSRRLAGWTLLPYRSYVVPSFATRVCLHPQTSVVLGLFRDQSCYSNILAGSLIGVVRSACGYFYYFYACMQALPAKSPSSQASVLNPV